MCNGKVYCTIFDFFDVLALLFLLLPLQSSTDMEELSKLAVLPYITQCHIGQQFTLTVQCYPSLFVFSKAGVTDVYINKG